MKNEFKDIMAKRTDEELIKITTTDRADYQPPAVQAADKEIEYRKLEFKKNMSQKSDKELITITINNESHSYLEIEAANSEIKHRNIDANIFKNIKKEIISEEKQSEEKQSEEKQEDLPSSNINAEDKQKVLVRTYKGDEKTSTMRFKRDAIELEKQGYFPTTQNWKPGSWGCGSFILAVILSFIIIGLIIFIYMLVVKPDGILTVTYEYKKPENLDKIEVIDEKNCPMCAEKIKSKAKVCRYCGYKFNDEKIV